jgi:hypothetical protein
MNEITKTAFFDELEKIGIDPLGYLGGGVKQWGKLLQGNFGKTPTDPKTGQEIGHLANIGKIWERGSANKGGILGGLKNVAKSRYGQMAAVPLAAYGIYRIGTKLLGRDDQPQYAYR